MSKPYSGRKPTRAERIRIEDRNLAYGATLSKEVASPEVQCDRLYLRALGYNALRQREPIDGIIRQIFEIDEHYNPNQRGLGTTGGPTDRADPLYGEKIRVRSGHAPRVIIKTADRFFAQKKKLRTGQDKQTRRTGYQDQPVVSGKSGDYRARVDPRFVDWF